MALLSTLFGKLLSLRREGLTLFFALRDPHAPLSAKLISVLVVAYAISPIDLIPDFIPVLGLLDDLVLVPLGLSLALRLIPHATLRDARTRAEQVLNQPKKIGKAVLVTLLVILAGLIGLAIIGFWLISRSGA